MFWYGFYVIGNHLGGGTALEVGGVMLLAPCSLAPCGGLEMFFSCCQELLAPESMDKMQSKSGQDEEDSKMQEDSTVQSSSVHTG